MTYIDILLGFSFFIIVLFLHIIVWRIKKPESEINAMLKMFIYLPSILFLTIFVFIFFKLILVIRFIDFFYSLILYFSLAAAYIQTYPAFASDIPSFKILEIIKQHMPIGLTEQKIILYLEKEDLLISRTRLLEKDNLIKRNDKDIISLNSKSKLLANFFIIFRKIYGLNIGAG